MKSAPTESWPEQNKRHLWASLDVLRTALKRAAEDAAAGRAFTDATELFAEGEGRASAGVEMSAPPALHRIATIFGLSTFERRLLLLCAGVELAADIAALCATVQGDPRRAHPTFGLALALLPDAHWSAVAPGAPLRRSRLVEVQQGGSLTTSPLRIDESILHHLTGVGGLDERLSSFLEPAPIPAPLAPSHDALAAKIAAAWCRSRMAALPITELSGPAHLAKRAVVAAACARLGLGLHAMRGGDVPTGVAERETLAALWERESMLSGSALLLDCAGIDGREHLHALRSFAERAGGPVVLLCELPLHLPGRPMLRFEVRNPEPKEQLELWQAALGEDAVRLAPSIHAVVAGFRLDTTRIQEAAEDVRAALATTGGEPACHGDHLLWDTARALTRGRIDEIAQRIDSGATWDDLVLPAPQLEILRAITIQVRQRDKVHEQWGFASRGSRGLGVSVLFAGPSGTGKTMAAEVLAGALRLDLYRIDLSQVVSKYIGETEKNLRRAFDAADDGGAILLFDEADALFGKRSEVKDSHDRYANIEVSYLLQRMEAYRGLAILTTNQKSALDQAFLRRLRFAVQFPFPDATLRREIWRRVFPRSTPTEGLDLARLAQLHTSGGNIRNIALNAAFLAAEAGDRVRMSHVLLAARAEYAKLEKPLTAAEIGGWT